MPSDLFGVIFPALPCSLVSAVDSSCFATDNRGATPDERGDSSIDLL